MSATADEFQSPEIEAGDYYERLGVSPSANAEEIDNHTKKYVANFKPELSDHDNADERWDRFNKARQTLRDEDEKEQYDTFYERFGPAQGSEAYEAWVARNRPKNPARVDPVRDLGLSPDDESSRQTTEQTTQQTTQQTSQRTTQQTTQQTSHRRTTRSDDLDTDGTFSTRASSTTKQSVDESTGSSFVQQIIDHVWTTTKIAVHETVAVLSMLGWLIGAYLAVIIGSSTIGTATSGLVQEGLMLGLLVGAGYLVVDRYFKQFTGFGTKSGPFAPPGRQLIESLETPNSMLVAPAIVGVLSMLTFLSGGGGFSLLISGVALLSVHGRFAVIEGLQSVADWSKDVDTVSVVLTLIGFATVFIQAGGGIPLTDVPMTTLSLVVITITYLGALLSPIAAVITAES